MPEHPQKEIWITLTGQIDQSMVKGVFQFAANATHDQIKTVHLLIQSGGGFVSDGICLYNFLKNLPINLVTYNMGNVSSMAVILYLAAKIACVFIADYLSLKRAETGRAESETQVSAEKAGNSQKSVIDKPVQKPISSAPSAVSKHGSDSQAKQSGAK